MTPTDGMTLRELRTYAMEHGVTLGYVTRKAEVEREIRNWATGGVRGLHRRGALRVPRGGPMSATDYEPISGEQQYVVRLLEGASGDLFVGMSASEANEYIGSHAEYLDIDWEYVEQLRGATV